MFPKSSTAVAAYASFVLPYIENHVDTVTGLVVVVVVLGFCVQPTAKVMQRQVQDW